MAELELRVAAVDEDDRRDPMRVVPLRISIPDKPAAGEYMPYTKTSGCAAPSST